LLYPAGGDGLLAAPEIPVVMRGRLLPLLAKILTLLGGHILEPSGPAPDSFLLFRGQIAEILVIFPDRLFFLGRKLLPPLETLIRLLPLLGGHVLPSFRSFAEAFLPIRGQLIPLLLVGSQNLLLLRIELVPGSGKSFTASNQGEEDHPQDQDQTVFPHLLLSQFFISPIFQAQRL